MVSALYEKPVAASIAITEEMSTRDAVLPLENRAESVLVGVKMEGRGCCCSLTVGRTF